MIRLTFGSARVSVQACSGSLELTLPNRVPGQAGTVPCPEGGKTGAGAFRWVRDGCLAWGVVTADCREAGTRAAAEAVYRRLFAELTGRQLYRVWNFVPRINEEEDGLEVYQQFSFGRSLAFEAAFPGDFEARMPAASAVGTPGNRLAVMVVAGEAAPQFFENPEQVPAYHYPDEYGPRSPSFARASSLVLEGVRHLFLSGTAAIRGSASRHVGDVQRQTLLTVHNLRVVAEAAGVSLFGEAAPELRAYRVYLRNESDAAPVKAILEKQLLQPGDLVEYVQAGICRRELDVEIEAMLRIAL